MTPAKPPIYILLIFPILLGGGLPLVVGLIKAYARISGHPLAAIPNINGLLIALPAFFLWLPLALLLSNTVLFVVPPLRRIAERYTAQAGRPGFRQSQILFGKIAILAAAICIPLIALGFIL